GNVRFQCDRSKFPDGGKLGSRVDVDVAVEADTVVVETTGLSWLEALPAPSWTRRLFASPPAFIRFRSSRASTSNWRRGDLPWAPRSPGRLKKPARCLRNCMRHTSEGKTDYKIASQDHAILGKGGQR